MKINQVLVCLLLSAVGQTAYAKNINSAEVVTPHPIRHPEHSKESQNSSQCHLSEDSPLCSKRHGKFSEFYRNFWSPKYHGRALAYCSKDDSQCGGPIADSYCKIMGYQAAKRNLISHNVGLTYFLNNQGECKGWRCDGFKLIACKGKLHSEPPYQYAYRSKVFSFPRMEQYRINWCYKDNKQCGSRVASSFCKRMGYDSATSYSKQLNVSATIALGDHQLCFGRTCDGFSRITCYR